MGREPILRGPSRPRVPCRVCRGAHWITSTPGASREAKPWLFVACSHCDEQGHARSVCGTCSEALPLCRCFTLFRAEVTT